MKKIKLLDRNVNHIEDGREKERKHGFQVRGKR